jgi:hypothetical protein
MSSSKRKDPAHPAVVYIEWLDAGNYAPGWQDEDDVPAILQRMERPLTASGFLISSTRKGVLLGLAYNSGNGDISGLFYVPRPNVVRMVTLRRAAGVRLASSSLRRGRSRSRS